MGLLLLLLGEHFIRVEQIVFQDVFALVNLIGQLTDGTADARDFTVIARRVVGAVAVAVAVAVGVVLFALVAHELQ